MSTVYSQYHRVTNAAPCRYWLAANIVMFLIMNNFKSPNRILTRFICSFCHYCFLSIDAFEFEEKEESIPPSFVSLISNHTHGVWLRPIKESHPRGCCVLSLLSSQILIVLQCYIVK